MIPPTVGRVVHFREMRPDVFAGSEGTCAAIVTWVWSDRVVNLAVFDAEGNTHSRTSVQLVQDGDEIPATAHCEWMPYQHGQAAKAEALQKQLAQLAAAGDKAADPS